MKEIGTLSLHLIAPTGAASVVADFIAETRELEALASAMVDNECWKPALDVTTEVERLKAMAGVEFLLWILALLNMPAEPNPWKELQEKLSREREEKKV